MPIFLIEFAMITVPEGLLIHKYFFESFEPFIVDILEGLVTFKIPLYIYVPKLFVFPFRLTPKSRVDETESYTLDGIRNSLIRQEDSIIFSLVERAQYCYNADTYNPDAFFMDGFHGSLVQYMVRETEKLHAKVYKSLFRPYL